MQLIYQVTQHFYPGKYATLQCENLFTTDRQ